jgi:hypothetical protein
MAVDLDLKGNHYNVALLVFFPGYPPYFGSLIADTSCSNFRPTLLFDVLDLETGLHSLLSAGAPSQSGWDFLPTGKSWLLHGHY